MNAADSLTTVAEIAVTIAGFAGIVAVFKSSGKLGSEEIRRIIFLVLVCASIIVTSLLPAALPDLGLSETSVSAVSCGILGVAGLVLGGVFAINIVSGEIHPLFPRATLVIVASITATGGVLLASAFSFGVMPSFGLLLLGEIAFLLTALWIFVATIIW